jgi:putative oxidoreductase
MSSDLTSRWIAATPFLLSVLRIMAAFVFVEYGTGKMLAWPGSLMPGGGTAPLMTQAGIAGLLEMVGGGLLLVGLFTRPVAFLLSGEMAFAYFIGHASQGWVLAPMMNRGESAALFCFIFLYLAVAGPGAWSLDALRSRRR